MHFQRIVGALVSSAVGAGRFYSEKVTQARDADVRAADGGDDEHGTPHRPRKQGAAHPRIRSRHGDAGARPPRRSSTATIDAYKDLTGEEWKAYEASADAAVEKKAAASQMGSFRGPTPPRGGIRKAPAPSSPPRRPSRRPNRRSPPMTASPCLVRKGASWASSRLTFLFPVRAGSEFHNRMQNSKRNHP